MIIYRDSSRVLKKKFAFNVDIIVSQFDSFTVLHSKYIDRYLVLPLESGYLINGD